MPKSVSKKIVHMFFVVAVLIQVSTIKPSREWLVEFSRGEHPCCLITLALICSPVVLSTHCLYKLYKCCSKKILCCHKKILQSRLYDIFLGDPCGKPSTGTKITALSLDCLCEIFDFYASRGRDRDFPLAKSLFQLRLVCDKFEQAVNERPLSFYLNCKNKEKKIDLSRLNHFGKIGRLILIGGDYSSIKEMGLEDLQSLRSLKMKSFHKFDGSGLEKLGCLYKLTICECGQFCVSVLKELTNLHTLEITSCGQVCVSVLKELTNLRKLKVCCYDKSTGDVLEKLINLQDLTVIYRGDNATSALKLVNLINLEKLAVWSCKNFTGAMLKKPANLQELELRACHKFDWSNFRELKKLRSLAIWIGKDRQHDKFDETALGELTGLQKLKVCWYKNFTGVILKKLINLQELELYGCCEFTGEVLKNIKNLRRIEMTDCGKFDGKWVENLKSLRFLKVPWSSKFSRKENKFEGFKSKMKKNGCKVIV